MKKFTAISTLAFGFVLLLSTSLQAMNPMHVADFLKIANSNSSIETEIVIQDWMISTDAFSSAIQNSTEKDIRIESWMITNNWSEKKSGIANDSRIELEDWMLTVSEQDSQVMASR